jgi:hypothetical protein
MTTIVFEHVPVSELPLAWRHRLAEQAALPHHPVTIRIESTDPSPATRLFDLLDGGPDLADVSGYLRTIRTPQYDFTPSGDGD